MKNLFILILFFLSSLMALSQNEEGTIEIDNLDILTDSIPDNYFLRINNYLDTLKQNDDIFLYGIDTRLYKSINNKFFLKVIIETPLKSLKSGFSCETFGDSHIEVYNDKSIFLWDFHTDKWQLSDCKISEDGIFNILWSTDFKKGSYSLSSYDIHGQNIFFSENIRNLWSNVSNNAIGFSSNLNDSCHLTFINCANSKRWNKSFYKSASILAISGNGKFIIGKANSESFLWNDEGITLWEKTITNKAGIFKISYNGKYSLWLPNLGNLFLIDNSTGEVLWNNIEFLFNNKLYKPYFSDFIENSEEIVVSSVIKEGLILFFIDMDGKIFNSFSLNEYFESNFKVIKNLDQYLIYFDGIKTKFIIK